MDIGSIHLDAPWFLLGLLALPLGWWWRRRARPGAMRHPEAALVRRLVPRWWRTVTRLPDLLRAGALAALVVALARPQTTGVEVLTGQGVDIMVALDMSGSMNAVDMPRGQLQALLDAGKTPPNRFEIARSVLRKFIRDRQEDRVGLVVFGKEAWLALPLTLDYARALALLDSLVLDDGRRAADGGTCLNACTIDGAGTAIGDAIARAYQRLRHSPARSRVIVLITDGKNEGGRIEPRTIVDYIASRPEDERVRIYTFLIGNDRESYIPVPGMFGGVSWRRPPRPFETDPALLQEIAKKTGGVFYKSYDAEKFQRDFADLEKREFAVRTRTHHNDVFEPFLWAGALLLALEGLLRFTFLRKFP